MDWKKNIRFIILLVLVCILIGVCSSCDSGEVVTPDWDSCSQNIDDHPCDFTLVDQNGDEFSLYDHIGKIVILDFSAMWCGPCQMAAVEVEELQKKYKNDIVYVMILIEDTSRRDPSQSDIKNWANVFDIKSAPVLAGDRSLLSPDPKFGWVLSAWPQFYVINKEMVLEYGFTGFAPGNIEAVISSMLEADSEASN